MSHTPASRGPANDHADHAVVAENVRQPDLQGENLGVVLRRSHFRIGVAARRQVVLVGFVDELDDAGPPVASKG